MSDKSPRQHLQKKSGKSLKEKRAAKKEKTTGGAASHEPVSDLKKRH
ncbi:MAG TPA: hypothetical protein VFG63_01765 [Nocardioidaceae bacterium]|nr:hypothetical protein [Nocardioidaceae bacterium]